MLGGTSFGEAFPFITKTAVVTVPIRYAKTGAETFGAAANKTGTAVKKTTKKTTDVGKNTVKAVGKTIRKGANQVKKIFK